MRYLRFFPCGIALLLTMFLVGCSSEGDDNLTAEEWLAQQKASPSVKPFQPPAEFVPLSYDANGYPDPFSAGKIKSQIPIEAIQEKVVSPFAREAEAEMKRPKGPLEAYPLSTIRFVGSIKNAKANIALLNIQNLVHQVRVGDRIGTNFGKVIDIEDNIVKVRELVQTGDDWKEQISELKLPTPTGSF